MSSIEMYSLSSRISFIILLEFLSCKVDINMPGLRGAKFLALMSNTLSPPAVELLWLRVTFRWRAALLLNSITPDGSSMISTPSFRLFKSCSFPECDISARMYVNPIHDMTKCTRTMIWNCSSSLMKISATVPLVIPAPYR